MVARRIRSFELNGNTLITSNRGILKSTSAAADLMLAGLPRALDMSAAEGAGTIFATASLYRAYRHTWALKDANNNLVIGAPSGRVIVLSTGVNKNFTLTLRIPPQITTSHVYQVFATAIGSTDPGDSMVQIYEAFPTSAEITAGTIAYEDKIPDAFRNLGVPLYTNTDQFGSQNAHTPPPLARDVCEFRGHGFYANYTEPHRMTLQLVDPAPLTNGVSMVTIAGIVYTSNAAEVITTGTFQEFTAGSAAQNCEDTAKSLVRVINGYAANTSVYAFYASTPDTVPGKILIEERGLGGSAFVAIADSTATGNCFVPPLPTTGSTYTSIADRRRNRIRVSLPGEGEHCPIYRDIVVGAEYDEIQRTIALQEMVIVIKNRTIWRITGSVFEDFIATIHDDTCSIAGRDSAAKLNNTIFALSNQGFIAISSTGVQIVGRPEEHRVLAALDALSAPNHDQFVGIGSEAERLYLCRAWDAAGGSTITYAYNAITRQWAVWTLDPQCMTVVGDRILYGLDNTLGHVLQERSSRRDGDPQQRDAADESATFTIASIDTAAKTVTGTIAYDVDMTGSAGANTSMAGWKLYDGSSQYLVLSGTGISGSVTLTLNTVDNITVGSKTMYRPIYIKVEWLPITGGNPAELKQWGDVTVRCQTQDSYFVQLKYANEYDRQTDPAASLWISQPAAIDAYISPDQTKPSAANTDFGATRGFVNPNNVIVSKVAKDRSIGYQLSVKLLHNVAESKFAIKSLVVDGRPMGTNKGHQ